MAKPFNSSKFIDDVDKALDKGLARFLILTQGKLSKSSPIDSGRLASSFFISANTPSTEVPDKRKGSGKNGAWRSGKDSPTVAVTKPSQKITMENDWWITSSLPYSERVAFDPRYAKGGRSGGAAWYTRIANGLSQDAEKAFSFFLKKIK